MQKKGEEEKEDEEVKEGKKTRKGRGEKHNNSRWKMCKGKYAVFYSPILNNTQRRTEFCAREPIRE